MPELPEVETIRRQLAPRLAGRSVIDAWSHWSGKFTPAIEVVGSTIVGLGRRGKFLLAELDDGRELVVHLGMTGRLAVERDTGRPDDDRPPPVHLRAWWQLDDGQALSFVDVRRFGRIRVVSRGHYDDIPALSTAGPEPFDPSLDGAEFARRLGRSRRKIKTQLLSQRPVAGVGNIYADEALWMAGINPAATRIGPARAARLLSCIREALRLGIENGGTTLRDYRDADGQAGDNQHSLQAYGRRDRPCLRCGTPMRSRLIDARTTTYCPTCQRR